MQESGSDRFSGFAAGRAAVSLPAQFFADLLPLIDDEAELRVTLAVLYATAVLKGPLRAVTAARLGVDVSLLASLQHCGGPGMLIPALERAAARGAILILSLADGGLLCFANDAAGRRSFDRVRTGARLLPPGLALASVPSERDRSLVVSAAAVYEAEIGPITPAVADALSAACERYGEGPLVDALRAAALGNVRRWSYVIAILRRRSADGLLGSPSGETDAAAIPKLVLRR